MVSSYRNSPSSLKSFYYFKITLKAAIFNSIQDSNVFLLDMFELIPCSLDLSMKEITWLIL